MLTTPLWGKKSGSLRLCLKKWSTTSRPINDNLKIVLPIFPGLYKKFWSHEYGCGPQVFESFREIPWSLSIFIHTNGNAEDEKHHSLMHLRQSWELAAAQFQFQPYHWLTVWVWDSLLSLGLHPALCAGRFKWLDRASLEPIRPIHNASSAKKCP